MALTQKTAYKWPIRPIIIRSRRRTLSVEIRSTDAALVVRAPKRVSETAIERFLAKHKAWIEKHATAAITRQVKVRSYSPGDTMPYLGVEYPITIRNQETDLIRDTEFALSAHALPHAKNVFEKWYKAHALLLFQEIADAMLDGKPYHYSALKLSHAKRQWGSCSPDGVIRISWRLILAPRHIIEYVIAHEIAHLKVRRHGKTFWKNVETMYPNHQEARKWLRDEGYSLHT